MTAVKREQTCSIGYLGQVYKSLKAGIIAVGMSGSYLTLQYKQDKQ